MPTGPRSRRCAERGAFNELQDKAGDAVRLLEAIDRTDVRVVQSGEDPRFAGEARLPFRIIDELRWQDVLIATSRPSLLS